LLATAAEKITADKNRQKQKETERKRERRRSKKKHNRFSCCKKITER
jgi:hypothetical protein